MFTNDLRKCMSLVVLMLVIAASAQQDTSACRCMAATCRQYAQSAQYCSPATSCRVSDACTSARHPGDGYNYICCIQDQSNTPTSSPPAQMTGETTAVATPMGETSQNSSFLGIGGTAGSILDAAAGSTGNAIKIASQCGMAVQQIVGLLGLDFEGVFSIGDISVAFGGNGAYNKAMCCVLNIIPGLKEAAYKFYSNTIRQGPSTQRMMTLYGIERAQAMGLDVNTAASVILHYSSTQANIYSKGSVTLGHDIFTGNAYMSPNTLVHELTHVKQFVKSAGASESEFGKQYITQWCNAGDYMAIPWEQEAFAAQQTATSYFDGRQPPYDYQTCLNTGGTALQTFNEYQSLFDKCVDKAKRDLDQKAADPSCTTPGLYLVEPTACRDHRTAAETQCAGQSKEKRYAAYAELDSFCKDEALNANTNTPSEALCQCLPH